ncbi:YbbR-like domain-containing protein [Robertkochia marina]|uniref:YbbR-like domain-containing protein n=1 Tax=Robertkochia marina TaxID=1227945 RepID=A0A4S3M3G6_9FLAO|nr:YbbR-like domain-containing protein [Robertkochia marina]THD68045.1 YbbR-like domain-containing protein [Robertkochia marina]TRZ42671.1 YbbR-like domain-containing protein [Robertkochia marina]
MVQNIKKRFIKPKALAFLGFLLVSFIIWLMITLSGSYVSDIRMQLAYENVPEEKLLLGDPDSYLDASVYASGYRLLNYKIFRESLSLDVASFNEGSQRFFITRAEMENSMKDQMEGLEVRRVFKDTLWLTLGENTFRKIKVSPNLTIGFQEDHEFSEPLKIIPDSIEVRGPEDLVRKIDSLTTASLVLRNLKDDFEKEVQVVIPDSLNGLQLSRESVVISGKVARYSEKILEVPLVVENVPEGVSVKTFPANIRILCKADIDDLKRVVPSGFRISCDYNEISKNPAFLLPRVEEKPSFVKSVTLLDTKVEYLLKRS